MTGAPIAAEPTLDRQIATVHREVQQRERAYPRWVLTGRYTQARANEELWAMRGVLATLKKLKATERLL